ncbi:MAG: MATE family efflux transporter [Oscillospiraceae bacterium]|nr:MATE family efflux transporter [Oscillospiraceae bacterium]
MAKTQNMTTGSEAGHIIRFALPLLGGNILQQTYNIVDTAIVGRVLGGDALAAVGATGSVTFLFFTVCMGLSTGAGIIVSQFFGANNKKRLNSSVVCSALVTLFFGLLTSIISVMLAVPILKVLKVPDELVMTAATYMRIACGGTVCVAAYNWINAIMRSLGDSKTPLVFLIISSVINVGLDILFVVGFGMGVAGAALATVIAQGISATLCIIWCFKDGRLIRVEWKKEHISRDMIFLCIRTGIPVALQFGLISVSMAWLQRVTNGFGSTVMAAYTIAMRIEQFVHQPFASISTAISTFTGQNIGAEKKDRAVKGLRSTIAISTVMAFIEAGLFMLLGRYIAGIFVTDEAVIDITSKALLITASCYWALGLIYTVRGFLNGSGDTGYALLNGIAEVIGRCGLSAVLPKIPAFSFWGIWFTTSITWLFTAIVGLIRYKSGRWASKSIVKAEETE